MYARRKIDEGDGKSRDSLKLRLLKKFDDENVKVEVEKDFHLISAALGADKLIVSMDDKQREYLSRVADEISQIGNICWVNPTDENFEWEGWLEDGAASNNDIKLRINEE